jgi:hypothetical protein
MTDAIARYSFLPWLRRGLATRVAAVDNLGAGPSGQGERAEIAVTLRVNDASDVTQAVRLFGPGDITSIEARAVVRTDPRAGITDFEPNYFAAIEFYDEDFPWRYTPASSTTAHRLRPWIALVVLAEDEFERRGIVGPLPAIRVASPAAVLPPPGELWAWAHAHVSRDLLAGGGGAAAVTGALAGAVAENPDLAISRILCPRKLRPNTAYRAFVIPTFETGRLAGTGQEIASGQDGLAPAWGHGQDLFPVYYEWSFRTGERGDFEYLVRLLQPRQLDPRVGTRDMDVTDPGPGLPGIVNPPALGLEGALKTPQTVSTPWPDRGPFQTALAALVNLPETLTEPGSHQDPIVAPPLYGRWPALVTRAAQPDNPPWVDELNLDPRLRSTAGFGTRVVQKEQEGLMASAWRQVGDVLAANRKLQRAQYAREATLKMYARHLAGRTEDTVLSMTQPVHARVLASPMTVSRLMAGSRLPAAAVDPAFRRIARPRGPVLRRMDRLGARPAAAVLGRINQGQLVAAPAKPVPSRVIAVEALGDQLFPRWAPTWLRPLLPFARARAAGLLSRGRLPPAVVTATPRRPDFQITTRDATAPAGGPRPPQTGGTASESVEAARFRAALLDTHTRLEARIPQPAPPPAFDLARARTAVLTAIHPDRALPARVLSVVQVPPRYVEGRPDPIDPVMAAPSFPQPMYEPLRDISAELLIPNLDLIPLNTISLLQTNERFVEAYMVGLNHEMARELLWREYPTDQRGSYFRQFWDVSDAVDPAASADAEAEREKRLDVKRIHEWARTAPLGANANRPLPDGQERAVLVLRSDLLKKYPTTVIYAVNGVWPSGFGSREMGTVEKYPVFHAEVGPDLTFVGFDLTIPEAKGSSDRADGQPGWFFVLKQRPGEPRFGLDIAAGPAPEMVTDWDEISWGNLAATQAEFDAIENVAVSRPLHNLDVNGPGNPSQVSWGANAADMAYILHQDPVLVAVHASEMLP